MAKKPLAAKPGTQPGVFRPDNIETYTAYESLPAKLLDFLIAAMPERKRTTVKDYLKHRQVMVGDNVVTQFDTELTPGDEVKVNTTREFQTFTHPRLKIVYEDDDIIVINKGYGLLSMGTDKIKDGTAYSILREYLKRKDPRNKLFIIHRLDRDTTGLMIFAKTMRAKETMQHNWNNMVLERNYVAVVEGYIEDDEGTIRSYLNENAEHEVYSTPRPVNADSKLAVTRYRVLDRSHGHTLVELSLDTGRKNQIRVHMKDLGHPIVGDRRYGAATSPIHRLALHARTLKFVHPNSRRPMDFSTGIPAAFLSMMK